MTDRSPRRSRVSGTTTQHARTTLRRPRAFAAPTVGREMPVDPAPRLAPDPRTDSLLDRHPVEPPLTVTHERSITGHLAEQLWESYCMNVGPLAELAILRHLDTYDDVLAMFANPRIDKIVAWRGSEPIGLGMVTNSLEDVSEISPPFLRARYPDYAARDAIYVGMLVMVSPHVRGMTVFSRIYTELWQVPARARGILVFDVCEFNRVTFGADDIAARIAAGFPRASVEMLDRQTWYVADLPEPLPERRH
ncbi:MAG: hypothetical protein ACRDZZ_08260 [Ilumatobacteraceae bacterium]